jgi:hypothetical protein
VDIPKTHHNYDKMKQRNTVQAVCNDCNLSLKELAMTAFIKGLAF